MSRTDAFVDVDAVRICTHCIKVCFQIREQTVDDRRSCPRCRIQTGVAGKVIRNGQMHRRYCAYFRTPSGYSSTVPNPSAEGLGKSSPSWSKIGFDLVFLFVRQFEAIRSEEFNTVIACRMHAKQKS